MVRNAVSMHNLRSNMSDVSISPMPQHPSPQSSTSRTRGEQPRIPTLGSRPSIQLLGQDKRTKAIMNRIATGQATKSDHAQFNDYVQSQYPQHTAANSLPPLRADEEERQIEQRIQRELERDLSEHWDKEIGKLGGARLRSPMDNSADTAPPQDFQVQLMELEKQNRERLVSENIRPDQAIGKFTPQDSSKQKQKPKDVLAQFDFDAFLNQTKPCTGAALKYKEQLLALNRRCKDIYLQAAHEPGLDSQSKDTLLRAADKEARRPISDDCETESGHQPVLRDYLLKVQLSALQEERNRVRACQKGEYEIGEPAFDLQQDQEANHITDFASIEPWISRMERSPDASDDYKMKLQMLDSQIKKSLLIPSRMNETPEQKQERETYRQKTRVALAQQEQARMHAQVAEIKARKGTDCSNVPSTLLESLRYPKATGSAAQVYCEPFCDFLTDNPTVFHAVDSTKRELKGAHWTELNEREAWDLKPSGKYFVERNGSSLIAFVVGENYKPGNGAAILAGHVDALCAKLKPISEVPNKAGYLQLGVAPYAGAMSDTWWDRDLGIGGRVLVKEGSKIVTKLVKLDRPIARIPSLAPHFGAAAQGPFNKETQMTPIIGLEGDDVPIPITPQSAGAKFVSKQPPALVRAIGSELGLSEQTYSNIVNWELELFDVQPATVGGLNKEFIYGGRIDDKLCSWAAMQALTGSALYDTRFSSLIKVVAWFDDEEIGSQLRQGARSNFLPNVLERAVGSLAKDDKSSDLMGRTYANSFIVSSDVTHAVNPNFVEAYLRSASPTLNTGLVVCADANGHMTTDAISTAILQRCADRVGAKLQLFQIRNDSRSGGTVGPMLSSMTGIRAIDAGMPQLSMHSIRATTGSLDPGLGVIMFTAYLNGFEHVDKEFR